MSQQNALIKIELLQVIETLQRFSLFLNKGDTIQSYASGTESQVDQHFAKKKEQESIRDFLIRNKCFKLWKRRVFCISQKSQFYLNFSWFEHSSIRTKIFVPCMFELADLHCMGLLFKWYEVFFFRWKHDWVLTISSDQRVGIFFRRKVPLKKLLFKSSIKQKLLDRWQVFNYKLFFTDVTDDSVNYFVGRANKRNEFTKCIC